MERDRRTGTMLSWLFTLHHYYGDVVRQLFITAAVIMLLLVPFLATASISFASTMAVAAVLLVLFAGLTAPRYRLVAFVDTLIAGLGCIFFELLAMQVYAAGQTVFDFYFIGFQLVALDFLGAFYFSIKTLRAMNTADEGPEEDEEPASPSRPSEYGL